MIEAMGHVHIFYIVIFFVLKVRQLYRYCDQTMYLVISLSDIEVLALKSKQPGFLELGVSSSFIHPTFS